MDHRKNVTYINELIDLDNEGNGDDGGMLNSQQAKMVGRAIRTGSGGSTYKMFGNMQQPGRMPREDYSPPTPAPLSHHTSHHTSQYSQQYATPIEHHEPERKEYYTADPVPRPTFNCIQIAEHIKECPICSILYNNDRTLYIIAIIILAVIVIILLKKVLET